MRTPWSAGEIEATVAAYFEMLRLEVAGLPYVKADYNERLRRVLSDRSKAAVEYKFQNISAVLVNHGQVYIRGYLPAQNYQRALEAAVLEWIAGRDDLVEALDRSPLLNPPPPSRRLAFAEILSPPPDPRRVARPSREPVAVKVDFVRLDAENRALGTRGEEFVYELERRRLHDRRQPSRPVETGALVRSGRGRRAGIRHPLVRTKRHRTSDRGEDDRRGHLHPVRADP